jgi:hypothetical protein
MVNEYVRRAATAALVEKQSSEMLELINEARSEYMQQESLYLDEGVDYVQGAPPSPYPWRAPPPHPPALAKYQLYNDPLEFADIDQIAISVSSESLTRRPRIAQFPCDFAGLSGIFFFKRLFNML